MLNTGLKTLLLGAVAALALSGAASAGTLTIDSRPGQGTRLTAVVVTPAYDAELEGAQSDA